MSQKRIETVLAEANAKVGTMEAELTQANAANIAAADTEKQLASRIAILTSENADLVKQVAGLKESAATVTTQVATLTATITKLEAEAKTATQVAGKQLANIVTPPVAGLANADAKPTKAELWAQYRAMNDPYKQREFYLANEKEMSSVK